VVVRNAWQTAILHGQGFVAKNLKEVVGELKDWNKSSLGDLEKHIARKKKTWRLVEGRRSHRRMYKKNIS
jgi:hypothetical protein